MPGNVHLDLSAAGVLPRDLFYGENINSVCDYEFHEWWYTRSFDYSPRGAADSVTLDFAGVDCYAEYYLNGELLGCSDNAFIEHGFDATEKLLPHNELVVHILPTVLQARRGERPVWTMLYANPPRLEFQCVRAPAHSFGWDIMPHCVGAGIWRSVSLCEHGKSEIADAYFYTDYCNEKEAHVIACVSLNCTDAVYMSGALKVEVEVRCGGSVKVKRTTVFSDAVAAHLVIKEPRLWWPRVVVSNASLRARSGSYTVRDADSGELLASGDFTAPANENADIGFIPVMYSQKRILLIDWESDGEKGHNHYLAGSPAFDLGWYKSHLGDING